MTLMYSQHSQASFIDFRTIFRTMCIQCVKLGDFYEVLVLAKYSKLGTDGC